MPIQSAANSTGLEWAFSLTAIGSIPLDHLAPLVVLTMPQVGSVLSPSNAWVVVHVTEVPAKSPAVVVLSCALRSAKSWDRDFS